MKRLRREDRLRLMKFVCSFAWADLEVQAEERAFVAKLARTLKLDDEERAQVEEWLKTPPRPEEVDPTTIPKAHREIFLDTVKALVAADGKISVDEAENLALFRALLR